MLLVGATIQANARTQARPEADNAAHALHACNDNTLAEHVMSTPQHAQASMPILTGINANSALAALHLLTQINAVGGARLRPRSLLPAVLQLVNLLRQLANVPPKPPHWGSDCCRPC